MKINAQSLGRLVLINTVLLGLNTLLLGALLLRDEGDGAETAASGQVASVAASTTSAVRTSPPASTVAGAAVAARASSGGGTAGAAAGATGAGDSLARAPDPEPLSDDPVENFILSTVSPLRAAARDRGDRIVLPTDAELDTCLASGAVDSPACGAVLDTLRAGYERCGMPFPSLPDPDGAGGPAVTTARGRQVLQVYLDTLQERLRAAALARGERPADVLPDAELVAAAVASGDPASEATAVVLDQLREQYEAHGLRFTEPYIAGGAAATATPGSSSSVGPDGPIAGGDPGAIPASADRELLQSYLDHMVHRLERAARAQGRDPAALVPDSAAVEAAIATGRVDSAETGAVLEKLRAGYAGLDLTFTEPPL